MNNFFTLKDLFIYFKTDLIGAIVIFVVGLMFGASANFYGTLSSILFILVLLFGYLKKKNLGRLEKNLFQLTRMTLLISVVAEAFLFGFFIYNGTIFTSFKLPFLIINGFIWALVAYKLMVKFSQDLEEKSTTEFKKYKYPFLILIVTYLLPLLFG